MRKLIIIKGNKVACQSLKGLLENRGYEVKYASTFKQAEALINNEIFDFYLIDLILAGGNGITLMRKIKEKNPLSKIIVITDYSDEQSIIDAIESFNTF
ncbi:MAG: response regulator [Candidatus Lokiarchaeota archaeon]|nr:response regulator [Candidatus Lokiarchaeota archaeon]